MDDLISRQAVKDWLLKWEGYIDKDTIARMQYRVIDIPSTQPKLEQNTPSEHGESDKLGVKMGETCTDTISRQAAIAEFSCCELTPDGGIDANYAIDFLKQLPSAQPKQRWIPCDKGEPGEDKECWVTVKTADVYRGNFTKRYGERRDKGFITSGGGFMWWNTALAWMPIYEPEPYKER